MISIKDIPDCDKPREKLVAKGAEALSDTELIAILLGRGIKGCDVLQVARKIDRKLEAHNPKIEINNILSVKGVGIAGAARIMAAFELVRRRTINERVVIKNEQDIIPLILDIADKKQEYLICITLSGANEVIGKRVVTVGLVNANQIHPREVFADAILDRAASVILAHNHPSGLLKPSPDDLAATNQIVEAGKIIGINVLDHIIITSKGFVSLKSIGLL